MDVKPFHAETADVDLAFAIDDLLRQRFADGGGVFESMARTGRRDDDAIAVRVNVDDEVRIGRRRIQAARRGSAAIGNSRQTALDIIFVHGLRFFHADRPVRVIRIADRGKLLCPWCSLVHGGKTLQLG